MIAICLAARMPPAGTRKVFAACWVQGQIFRFIPKPVKVVTLKQALMAAALKRRHLRGSPDIAKRHRVERVADDAKEHMFKTIQLSAASVAAGAGANLLRRIGGSFRRMLGHA